MAESGGGETVFYARALQNWKSKDKGALSLSKGGLVKVLSGSADGEKFFGEVGKKKGWFPQIYVKREAAGGIVQSFRPSGGDSGDGDSSPPAISGPTHVRQHSQSLETLSLLADQLPPNAIADLGDGKAKEEAAGAPQDDGEGGSGSRILKRSVTVNHLRQQSAGGSAEDRMRLDDILRGSGGRFLGRSLEQPRIPEVGEEEYAAGAQDSDHSGVDKLTEEQNAAIARLKRNRTLPHLRPPMPSVSHSPVTMAFSNPALSPSSISMTASAPVSPRSSSPRTSLRPILHNGTTSHSFGTLPLNALGSPSGAGGPSSPRSRVMSVYQPLSQPSSPTSSSSSPPASLSSNPLESPRRTRSSSSHSAPHPVITSIFPQRSLSMEAQAVQQSSMNNGPSPLSKLGATSTSSRRQSKSHRDEKKEEKKKKKEEKKEKREGSRRKPNPKKGSTRQPGRASGKEVFGVSLEELMQRQRLDHPHLQVPIVLLNCAHAIILLEGHKKEGIFRISGNAHNLEALKETIREQEYADDFLDAHNAASLMKLWLSSLPQSLIPDTLTQRCTESIGDPEKSLAIVSEMPEINQKTLGYVIQFLQQLILPEKAVTKMDEDNLAMTLVPVIFDQNGAIGDMAEIVKQTQLQKMFVVNLLQHMQFATPLAWKDFEDAIEVINIKTAANQQMARELKKKGKAGGLIGGLVKPFSPGEKASKEGAQYNTYHPSSGPLASPRYEDLSSSGSGAVVEEVTTEEETEEEDELYEFG